MYSVLRIEFQPEESSLIATVASDINALLKDASGCEDREPGRMSIEIATAADANAHMAAIREALVKISAVLNRYRGQIQGLEIDLLYENTDWSGAAFEELRFEPLFLDQLHKRNIGLVVSIMPPTELAPE